MKETVNVQNNSNIALNCKLCKKDYYPTNNERSINGVCFKCTQKAYDDNYRLLNFQIKNMINFSKVEREETIVALKEIKKLYELIYEKAYEIAKLKQCIETEKEAAANAYGFSGTAVTMIFVVTMVAFIWRWICGSFLSALVVGVIAFIGVLFVASFFDSIFNSEEHEKAKSEYEKYNVTPLQNFLKSNEDAYDKVFKSESFIWAINAIGKEYFNMDTIDCFIEYLHKQRADSLKEAKNLFEEEMHRARMEQAQQEMLESARNTERAALNTENAALSTERAAKIAAENAVKQTAIQRALYRELKK